MVVGCLEITCIRRVAVMVRYYSWRAVARPLHSSHKIAHATICATKIPCQTDNRQLCKYSKRHACRCIKGSLIGQLMSL